MFLTRCQVVYLIYNPELKITKIGVASNIVSRLSSLRCASGCDLQIYYLTKPIYNAVTIERMMHDRFRSDLKVGEWFYGDPEKIKEVLISFENDYGTLDKIIAEYMSGISITELASDNNVTRQAILKRIKSMGVKREDPEVYNEDKFIDVSPALKRGVFKKIKPNLFFSGDCYLVEVYANKKMNKKYFITEAEAVSFLVSIKSKLQ